MRVKAKVVRFTVLSPILQAHVPRCAYTLRFAWRAARSSLYQALDSTPPRGSWSGLPSQSSGFHVGGGSSSSRPQSTLESLIKRGTMNLRIDIVGLNMTTLVDRKTHNISRRTNYEGNVFLRTWTINVATCVHKPMDLSLFISGIRFVHKTWECRTENLTNCTTEKLWKRMKFIYKMHRFKDKTVIIEFLNHKVGEGSLPSMYPMNLRPFWPVGNIDSKNEELNSPTRGINLSPHKMLGVLLWWWVDRIGRDSTATHRRGPGIIERMRASVINDRCFWILDSSSWCTVDDLRQLRE